MKDSLASTFLILALAIGLPFALISIALVIKKKGAMKAAAIFLSVLAIMLVIGTLVNAIIGINHARDYGHHPCTWVALGLSCGAMAVGLIALCVGVYAFFSKSGQQAQNSAAQTVTDNGYVIVKKKIDGDVALFTAASNNGVGLWTSICISFASIFGVESVNYTRKMNMVLTRVSSKLEEVMKEYPEFEYRDFRVIKEGNLAYTASVMGIRKK